MAPIQNVAPKINKMALIQNVAPKIIKIVSKIDKMAPIQNLPQTIYELSPNYIILDNVASHTIVP